MIRVVLVMLLAAAILQILKRMTFSPRLPAAEGKQKILKGGLLVDVRTPLEFDTGHVAGAINIPLDQLAQRLSDFGADKNREIVLYCKSGARAGMAQQALASAGYTRVFNSGGFSDWQKAGCAE